MFRANVKCQAANKLDAYMRRPRSSLLVSPAVSPREMFHACGKIFHSTITKFSHNFAQMLYQLSGAVVTLWAPCMNHLMADCVCRKAAGGCAACHVGASRTAKILTGLCHFALHACERLLVSSWSLCTAAPYDFTEALPFERHRQTYQPGLTAWALHLQLQGSSGFAAALQDDSAASSGRLLGDGSEGAPRLGIFKRAMSLGSGTQQRQGQSNRLSRNHPQSSNIFEPLPDEDEDS